MKPGDEITIKARVLRVDGDRVDTQTSDGQLIQTDVSNVHEMPTGPITLAGGAIEHNAKEASKGNRPQGRQIGSKG